MISVGILALQGGFEAHRRALTRAGADASAVRRVAELRGLAGLVLPGGESTTLLNLMRDEPWFEGIRRFHAEGGALFGTCAGAILLAREVVSPAQPCLGLLDAVVERNAYGRQVDSFETEIDVCGHRDPLRAVFIRAPRFRSVGSEVEVLATHESDPVLVRQGRVLAGVFHPELTDDARLHGDFVRMAEDAQKGVSAARGKVERIDVPWPRGA
jgi:5'-phosphate synthase pdxT subunit